MSNPSSLSLSAPTQNLHRLTIVRGLLILLLCTAIGFTYSIGKLALPYASLVTVILVMTCINVFTWYRLHKLWPVTELEFFMQLVLDIVTISILLYYCGGAGNPFVSYYLVPLCISAATLPWRYTWIIALLSLTYYTLLLFFHADIPELSHALSMEHSQPLAWGINLHILGMWFNFLVSTVLITYFVVKMATALRQQESLLVSQREENLRNEQVMAVATLAAGTAHELGTPLSTMKVLLSDLQQEHREDSTLSYDLQLLQNQLTQCSTTLNNLVKQAQYSKEPEPELIRHYCRQLIEHWLVMRPDVTARVFFDVDLPELEAIFAPTIAQSIINLLNNAADASPERVDVHIRWNEALLMIDIQDSGPGVPVELTEQLGKPFITTKGKGLGLGLFLTHATLSRYQGTIRLYNREEGGTLSELRLPLQTVIKGTDTQASNNSKPQTSSEQSINLTGSGIMSTDK